MIDSEKLVLETIAFEAKFTDGYLYWDHCGAIWAALKSRFPKLEMVSIDPQRAAFKLGEAFVNISFNVEQLNVSQQYPTNIEEFAKLAMEAMDIITNALSVETFIRVGTRFIHAYPLPSIGDEAVKLISSTGLFQRPPEKLAKFGETLSEPEIKFIVHDQEIGTIVRLAELQRRLAVVVPPPLKIDSTAFITNGLLIDFDRYTLKPIERASFRADDWINTTARNVRRGVSELFS